MTTEIPEVIRVPRTTRDVDEWRAQMAEKGRRQRAFVQRTQQATERQRKTPEPRSTQDKPRPRPQPAAKWATLPAAEVIAAYQANETLAQIGERYGVSRDTITKVLQAHDTPERATLRGKAPRGEVCRE